MSDLLDLVKSSYYHNVLGYHDAEARLEGREGSYLFRESDVKKGMFIISYVRNSSVAHILTPTKNGKYIRQSLEEAVDIAADVIASSDSYQNPVPPPAAKRPVIVIVMIIIMMIIKADVIVVATQTRIM